MEKFLIIIGWITCVFVLAFTLKALFFGIEINIEYKGIIQELEDIFYK